MYGYLPAKRFGSDDETRLSHKKDVEWIKRNHWKSSFDDFDYGKALPEESLPPILYICSGQLILAKFVIPICIRNSGKSETFQDTLDWFIQHT